ncbi:neutral zinc metallopeptidase [Campylobacter corcagiensis]|uniref:Zinc metallopeptidase n=1 Tax=Campylobacter corcagiensis TaxID=1448857 RepID=A0A7M1LIY7_9BACT|nr:neutral zinc metallopeptidase [Campylobacter corcagiensis]QKF65524.1 putative neutral zinc metallopeptidase [Campylobacter corcagiensis]QOQ87904.1 zinc metallopeptidase [Campylobacter corcagiensis]
MKWRGRKTSSNVEDKRMQTAQGGMNLQVLLPLIRWLMGSKIGRIILIIGGIAMLMGYNPLGIFGLSSSSSNKAPLTQKDMEMSEFAGVILAETENVWKEILTPYEEPKMVLFRGATNSGCGFASSQVGPFYCPLDKKLYLDLSFFDELAKRHDAPGDFAAAYVIAHEVGHHIQNLLGLLNQKPYSNKNQNSVAIELQADCFAGIWANHSKHLLEDGDIEEALNAASMIGDDVLQEKAQGYAVPDSFTHGSAKQRRDAFYLGYKEGDVKKCRF